MNYEDVIDNLVHTNTINPIDIVLYTLEQYILEDGVRGKDQFQDLVGDAWLKLRTAAVLPKGETK
jgi:hypothetical protein